MTPELQPRPETVQLMTRKNIGVLMGGLSAEREVSIKTGAAIHRALSEKGYSAHLIDVDSDIADHLKRQAIDTAFIALHGAFGEDGALQGMLEIMEIPYTGSGVLASALAMNKAAAKKIFVFHGVNTPAFRNIRISDDSASIADSVNPGFPLIVKPCEEGSTLGISVAKNAREFHDAVALAARFDRDLLIEEYIQGREITVAVLDGRQLPLIEIRPKSGFYDYRAKYTGGATEYIVQPDMEAETEDAVCKAALQAYHALGCRGAARVDVIVDNENSCFVLEVNTIPGMTETSLLPMAAAGAGIGFEALVEIILCGARLDKKRKTAMPGESI